LKIINDFGQESDQFERAIINNLTYVCTFGLKNDLRENAASSISLIRYGISKPNTTITDQVKVRMVSGDHIETCRRVALDAGIINKEEAEDP
jgi:magnesium-transporting ATPase (P-type)